MDDPSTVRRYDVCIVGAGISGLNALFVAAQRLGRGGRIALVDRRPRVGGMWNDTYDYVRLHQPHPLFTAGNIRWQGDRDPSYLATKPEVLDHLQHCLDVIESGQVQVDEYFGWGYAAHEEEGGRVRTTITRGDEAVVLESEWLVKALGFNIVPNEPLALTSQRVHSVSPDHCDVRAGEIASSDAPVWVVGGGKTGMDTAHALITARPGREVNLLAGSGTYFTSRDRAYPASRRWTTGARGNRTATEILRRYDGTNEADVRAWYLRNHAATVTPEATNFVYGILSEGEARTISEGLNHHLRDHLVDAVDQGDDVVLTLKSGATLATPPGSWIVNCTGYLLKNDPPYEPYVSPSGKVLSINNRSTTMLFTHYAGYYMTHLLLRGKLATAPLWELDWHALRRETNTATLAALATLLHNFTVLVDTLPPSVFLQFGVDVDRWYPTPRRLWGVAAFFATHRADRRRAERALQAVRDRYQVRCGPLEHTVSAPATP